MLPPDRFLRSARIYLLPCALLALAACSSHDASTRAPAAATPAAASSPVPYTEFADLQYFQLKDTNTVVLEFFDGSGTMITDLNCQLQTDGPVPVLHFHIFGNKSGPETKKFVWDNEGNAVYYFDSGAVDKAKMRVVYDDGQGSHDIPSAGVLEKPFQEEHREHLSAPPSNQP